jgi:hypothetical protein
MFFMDNVNSQEVCAIPFILGQGHSSAFGQPVGGVDFVDVLVHLELATNLDMLLLMQQFKQHQVTLVGQKSNSLSYQILLFPFVLFVSTSQPTLLSRMLNLALMGLLLIVMINTNGCIQQSLLRMIGTSSSFSLAPLGRLDSAH